MVIHGPFGRTEAFIACLFLTPLKVRSNGVIHFCKSGLVNWRLQGCNSRCGWGFDWARGEAPGLQHWERGRKERRRVRKLILLDNPQSGVSCGGQWGDSPALQKWLGQGWAEQHIGFKDSQVSCDSGFHLHQEIWPKSRLLHRSRGTGNVRDLGEVDEFRGLCTAGPPWGGLGAGVWGEGHVGNRGTCRAKLGIRAPSSCKVTTEI